LHALEEGGGVEEEVVEGVRRQRVGWTVWEEGGVEIEGKDFVLGWW